MENERGEQLHVPRFTPVSEWAAKKAVQRVTTGKTTDSQKYNQHIRRLQRDHPGFMAPLERLTAIRRLNTELNSQDPNSFQEAAYVGGFILYFSAAIQEAKLRKVDVPDFDESDFEHSQRGQAEKAGISNEQLLELDPLLGGFGSMSSMQEARDKQLDIEAHNTIFSDDPEANQQAVVEFVQALGNGFLAVTEEFSHSEREFVGVMNQQWWEQVDPSVSASQVFGAADAWHLIESRYLRAN